MKIPTFIPATILALGLSASVAWAADAAPAPAATEMPSVDHVIYLAHLPAPGELVQGAEAQHAKIDRMDQSNDRIVVTYSYANGRSVTFAYTLLSSIGAQPQMALSAQPASAPAPVAATVPSTATYVAQQPSTVVYTQPSTVYYEPAYSYYDPVWDFWAPVAIGVGLGWGWHGGWHSGYHSGWHGGGWHGGGHVGGWHR
ncbi:MAG TPA: hypothetical protein VHD32_05080 [Candidatus Didemnitutus sp.]|nr:hypothetical protein [Candidatus Didemnitutus sp.]